MKFQRLSPEQTGIQGDPSTDGGCHMGSSVKPAWSLPRSQAPQFRGGRALIVLACLFLPSCGPMANRIWPPWEPKPTKCEQIQCNSDETCVMRDGKPKCERKAGE
jgi:hypothetical protein